MAAPENEAMSIIPYPSSREIILRHKESIVVYDPESKQLVVRNTSPENKLDVTECPYCHRPLRDVNGNAGDAEHRTGHSTTASFASPEYFRMLHHSLPGSEDSSRPPSPLRRLTHAFTSPRSPPVYPSADAEFVGSSPALPPSSHGISSTAFSPNYFKKFFIEERELGRGGKGVVLLVKHVLDGVSLGHFALKRIPVGDDHEWLEKVLIEVQLLQHLSHQNLVSYRHVWLEDVQISHFGPSIPCAFVLQQYCNKGDLLNYICQSMKTRSTTEDLKQRIRRQSKNEPEPPKDLHGPRKLSFEEIYSFFRDITSGLNHLHVNGYIHRDLKPSNCLLHETGQEIRVLVSDFGEVQAEHMTRRATGATGTVSFCAPEVLRIEQSTGTFGNFTAKSDIFSLGMILYFLCFAQLPYRYADTLNEENEDVDLLREEIATWSGLEDQRSVRPDLPDKLYRFLRRLLSLNPHDRPSAEDILQGIRTGSGLDEPRETSPRSAGHVFEEVRNTSRILPVDSPSAGSPMPQRVNTPRALTTMGRQGPPGRLRLSSFSKGRRNSSVIGEDDDTIAGSPGGSLVLRSTHSSPVKISESPPMFPTPRMANVPNPNTLLSLKVVFLLLKVLSVNYLCNPYAANPTVALPLLGLAVSDILLNDLGLYVSFILIALHVVTVYGAYINGGLCYEKLSL
ncbi:putative serine/threonine-protein kinase iks1 [Xylographa opegraphella]|nr:putative serine/threonine-protein kinase iks1 [Xylographa opegraphella]